MLSIASAGLAAAALCFAPHLVSVLPIVPRDALEVVGTGGIVGAIGAFVAALATGLRARGSSIPRPAGYPSDHCAEVPRLINAYNVLKEKAQHVEEIEDGAELFAMDLYLKAVGRKSLESLSPTAKAIETETQDASGNSQRSDRGKIPQQPMNSSANPVNQKTAKPSTKGNQAADAGQPNLLAPRPVKPRSQQGAPNTKPLPPQSAKPQQPPQAKGKSPNPPSTKSRAPSPPKPKRES